MLRPSATWLLALVLTIFYQCANCALALEITPFRTANRSPLIQFHGIPSETSSNLQSAGHWEFGLTQDISSFSVSNQTNNEQANLDGELYRWALSGRYGLTEHLELGFELPYVLQGGGFLDGIIIDWHRFSGLPQGERLTAPKNRLNYSYIKNGVSQLDVSRASNGISDMSILAGYQLYSHRGELDHDTLALRAQIKLPTGDSTAMLGSGSTGLSLFLTGSKNSRTKWGMFGGFASAGGMYSSDGDIMKQQRQNLAGIGTAGLGWAPAEWGAFKIQLNLNTPLHKDSNLSELVTGAALFTFGGTLKLPDNYLLDIGVGEDIIVNTAPDVTFHLGLSKKF